VTFDNPLLAWGAERLRRDRKTLFAGVIFGSLESPWSRHVEELFTAFHYATWSVDGLLLLLWAPSRLAQSLAKEKTKGTLDMLRLTGLSGWNMALGTLGNAFLLPVGLVALTLPVALLGAWGEGGLESVIRGYAVLAPLAVCYALLAGMIGLAVKKVEHAGSSAVFLLLLILGVTALCNAVPVRDMRPLALLGPWGPGLTTTKLEFELFVLGVPVPGELLQLPVLIALAYALLRGLAQRLSGEHVLVLGRAGALWFAGAVAVISGLTFFPNPDGNSIRAMPTRAAFTAHLMVPFLCGLLLAAETTVPWRDLVRGLTRRDPDDLPLPFERLTIRRFLAGVLLPCGLGALLCLGVVLPKVDATFGGSAADAISVAGLLLGTGIGALAWLFAALALQAGQLWLKDRNNPTTLVGLGLAVLWVGPFLASYAVREAGAPPELYELPRAASPFFGLYAAGFGTSPTATSGFDPLALAVLCLAIYLGGCYGLQQVLAVALRRAQEAADGRVALPADAYGAPGTLTQRCPQGHLYSETWSRCPHCEAAGADKTKRSDASSAS
jgi:hypothetical protein